jgi:hypothetical protein
LSGGKAAIEKAGAAAEKMTPLEAAHIVAYTGLYYAKINSVLRKNKLSETQFSVQNILNNGLRKLPEYKGEVQRGTDLTSEQLDKYEVDKIGQETGFMSSSSKHSWQGNVLFKIKSLTGRDVSSMSQHPSEHEVLFPSHTFFHVKKKYPFGDKTVIEMEEMAA